jgi:glycosyltransferase involved in cell wall biosynthesis
VFYSPSKQAEFVTAGEIDILNKYKINTKKYILLVCGDRYEKGVYRACRALVRLFAQKNPGIPGDTKVVITGISYNKHYTLLTRGSDRFIFLDYIPTDHLEVLYKSAGLFIYPTLNEGFGYPPLEAMKYGTLCACSANSAITEICGDGVLYFNPYDDVEIGIRVLQSFDENIRHEKIEKMKARHALIRERQEADLDALVELIVSSSGTV